ncbi:hypothetical protein [Pedobacter nototheniae]|uniref:hypothetical protein n=1 Tax=Pedobacter nototheniae TaxID=2488994 RepID=UPI002931E4AC|nr:hypothetical protein [Pedobacter nototheniae]
MPSFSIAPNLVSKIQRRKDNTREYSLSGNQPSKIRNEDELIDRILPNLRTSTSGLDAHWKI